jgi:ribonuclease HI
MLKLYCDGGVVGRNPSPLGGTWAFVALGADDIILREASGVVVPIPFVLATITNNYTELYAALEALKAAPDGWAGDLLTDSQVTLYRITKDKTKWEGIPATVRAEVEAQRKRLGAYRVHLLDGHPTKQQLACGIGKRGNMCSAWNVRCDKECTRLAKAFLAEKGRAAA